MAFVAGFLSSDLLADTAYRAAFMAIDAAGNASVPVFTAPFRTASGAGPTGGAGVRVRPGAPAELLVSGLSGLTGGKGSRIVAASLYHSPEPFLQAAQRVPLPVSAGGAVASDSVAIPGLADGRARYVWLSARDARGRASGPELVGVAAARP